MKRIMIFIFLLLAVFCFANLEITQVNVVKKKSYNFFREYDNFFNIASEWAIIPGLKEKLVPQGICYVPEQNWFILTYYRIGGKPSVLAIIDGTDGIFIKAMEIYNHNGTPYTGHAGGVAVSISNLWISSSSYLWRIPFQEIIDAENGSKVIIADEFNTGTRASFASYSNGILWAGEFYHTGNYETSASHRMVARDGTTHHAWIAGFKLDAITDRLPEDKIKNIASSVTPDVILSIPDIVQGVEFLKDGRIVLSRSYGRSNDSFLQVYDPVLNGRNHTMVQISGGEVPVWFLDNQSFENELLILPMSEGITQKDNSIYVLFESAASKYLLTTKYPTDYIWKLEIEHLNSSN